MTPKSRKIGLFAVLGALMLVGGSGLVGCAQVVGSCVRGSDCDGGPCRAATCQAGRCVFVPRNSATVPDDDPTDCVVPACDDAGELLVLNLPAGSVVSGGPKGDCRKRVCDGAGHVLDAPDDKDLPDDNNPCTINGCSGGSPLFVPRKEGERVGKDTIAGDCKSMRCDGLGTAKMAYDPFDPEDDNNPCTTDQCNGPKTHHAPLPAGVTVSDGIAGNCKASKCGENGTFTLVDDDSDAGHASKVCTFATCSEGKSIFKPAPPGTTCNTVGGTCKTDGRCDRCPELDAKCTDTGPGEPNDTPATAHVLQPINDQDLFQNWPHVCGVLAGANDVDWYMYNGHDEGGIVDPGRHFPTDVELQVCVFFQCEKAGDTPKFSCPAATSSAKPVDGMPGCCGTSPFKVVLDCLPSGGLFGDDNASVFLRVSKPSDGLQCLPYELRYHY